MDPPFLWSGANLESERYRAGSALFQRLQKLELAGQSYHLIGHSHGGSVIWHALVEAAQQNTPLDGLQSWTSVGTPFLEFKPFPLAEAILRSAVVVLAGTIIVWTMNAFYFDVSSILRNVGPLPIALFAVFVLLIVLLALATLSQLGTVLAATREHRQRRAAQSDAAKWYGGQWQSIWHVLDEALAGIQASLTDPMTIAPRPNLKNAFAFMRPLIRLYDATLARAGDEFAWSLVTSKVQGGDLVAYEIKAVGPHPEALSPGAPPLDDKIGNAIVAIADEKAAHFLSVLRSQLGRIARATDSNEFASLVGSTMTWKEVIHTSYFDNADVAQLILERIKGAKPQASQAGPAPQEAPGREPGFLKAYRFYPLALVAVRNAALLVVVAAITFGATGIGAVFLSPTTAAKVEASIAAAIDLPQLRNIQNSGYDIGAIDVRRAGYDIASAFKLEKDESYPNGFIPYLAYHAGRGWAGATKADSLSYETFQKMTSSNDRARIAERWYALGKLDAGKKLDDAMVDRIWNSSGFFRMGVDRAELPQTNRRVPPDDADVFAILSSSGDSERIKAAVALMEKLNFDVCPPFEFFPSRRRNALGVRSAHFGSLEGVRAIISRCQSKAEAMALTVASAWAALEAGHREMARTLMGAISADLQPSTDGDINTKELDWQAALLLADAGHKDRFVPYIAEIEKEWDYDDERLLEWKPSELVGVLKQTNAELANKIGVSASQRLRKLMLGRLRPNIGLSAADELVRMAKILGDDGILRGTVGELKARIDSRDDSYRDSARYTAAYVIYSALHQADDASAAAAKILTEDFDDKGNRRRILEYQLRTTVPDRVFLDKITKHILQHRSLDDRSGHYGSLVSALAKSGYLFEAKTIADHVNDDKVTLACYFRIIDELLRMRDPEKRKALRVKRNTFLGDTESKCGEALD